MASPLDPYSLERSEVGNGHMPDRVRQWWPVVDEVTAESGLVTSEPVPASHAKSEETQRGRFGTAIMHRLMQAEKPPPF